MKWLIKLLGGYSKDEYYYLDKSRNFWKENTEYKSDEILKFKECTEKDKLELTSLLSKERKRGDKFYQQNYRARKYLNTITPTNQWKKHYTKVMEILDNN